MFAPSNVTPIGLEPTPKVPRFLPSLARSFVTVPEEKFVTHILVPSKTIYCGERPTGIVLRMVPSLATLTTVLPVATQMFAPS